MSECSPPVGRASSRAEAGSRGQPAGSLVTPSAFAGFLRFSDWLHARTGRTDSIALMRLMELLFEFLTVELKGEAKSTAEILWRDYQRGGRHDKPGFMKDYLTATEKVIPPAKTKSKLPKRQVRHQGVW